jgi:hypothetical protein
MSGNESARARLQGIAKRFPISSYAVSDEPVSNLSRHIAFAPSPTHSVHQSEHSVFAYGEIYGEHPMSFEFDASGNMIPLPEKDRLRIIGDSPRHCIETIRGLKQVSRSHEPMGPAGAICYS